MVQFYPWFKFFSSLFLGMVMDDNEFETKENDICTKDKIEPQQIHGNIMSKQPRSDQICIQLCGPWSGQKRCK